MRRDRQRSHGSTMTTTATRSRSRRSTPSHRAGRCRAPAARRRGLERLRSLFFQNSDLAQRYDMTFDRLVEHIWQARRSNPRLLLRCVNCVDDLIHAVACLDNNGLAWSDLPLRHERTLMRRCREGRDETETTVIVRRFVAELRRANLTACSPLLAYAGTRPLRNWLADELNQSLRRRQRAAFMIDLADTGTFGSPLRFTPSSGTGW